MSDAIDTALEAFLSRYPNNKLWLAFSGGCDSMVLLHALRARLADSKKLTAIHIDHRLQKESATWVEHARQFAKRLKVNFQAVSLTDKPPSGESIEAWAREKRYEIFAQMLGDKDLLLTAHHRDDQAETLLLQLLRGAGPKGLAAMPEEKPLAAGFVVRPLLNISKNAIEAYARAHDLSWIEDPSNEQMQFERNFVRHRIMPLLQRRWPQAKTMLAQSAKRCSETQSLLESLVAPHLSKLLVEGKSLIIDDYLRYEAPMRAALLRLWCAKLDLPMPGSKLIHVLEAQVLLARSDSQPRLVYGQGAFRRFQNKLYYVPLFDPPASYCLAWSGEAPLKVPHYPKKLTRQFLQQQGLDVDNLDWQAISVCSRLGAHQAGLVKPQTARKIKKAMQEKAIAPWLREKVPLLFEGERFLTLLPIQSDAVLS